MKTQFEKWLEKVNSELKPEFEKTFPSLQYKPITYRKGNKYIKLFKENSVWGFISMVDDNKKGERVGDLLKAASYNVPAKHPRGNIFEGTARYEMFGPAYLK